MGSVMRLTYRPRLPAATAASSERCMPMEPGTWIVTTSGKRAIQDVARDLAALGFAVTRLIGDQFIVGEASDDVIPKLRAVQDVETIEPDRIVDIGPPGAPETW